MTLTVQDLFDISIIVVVSPFLWKLANYAEEISEGRHATWDSTEARQEAEPYFSYLKTLLKRMEAAEDKSDRMLADLRELVAYQRGIREKPTREQRQRIITDAEKEAALIIADGRKQTERQLAEAREQLRNEVAKLAVQGAEMILKREINASEHKDLLEKLKSELR
jgi:F0F1-type ATP synthase membrane subunit b/b'